MKKIFTVMLSIVIFLSLITACQSELKNSNYDQKYFNETRAKSDELSIVTTIFPQYDFTKQIVADKANVEMLLKPGAESHSYEPTPQDIIKIQKSDLFIYLGGENDAWIEGILDSMGNEAPDTLRLIDLVNTLTEEVIEGMDHAHSAKTQQNHTDLKHEHEVDVHVWTSPIKVIEIVEHINFVLSQKDPNNANFYNRNTQAYIDNLKELDQEIRNVVEHAERNTVIFADRFPFRYFAEEYGLNYYAAFTGCSTDSEASASTVSFLINKTNELKLPIVFSIELSNEKIADSIVEATEAEKLTFHSVHNLSVADLENGENYLSIMERNLKNLKMALE